MRKRGIKVNGLLMAARYCLTPAKQRICTSKESDFKALRSFLLREHFDETERARQVMSSFPVMFPYLELIARENGISDSFDSRVVEAYYIGNELTDKVSFSKTTQKLYQAFSNPRLLGPTEAQSRIAQLSEKYRPHHNFHIFCFGSVTSDLDYSNISLASLFLSQCFIGWGIVKSAKAETAIIKDAPTIEPKNGRLVLEPKGGETLINYDPETDPPIKKGDPVSVHWGRVCQKLDRTQYQSLKHYTNLALIASNLWGEQ